MQLMKLTCAGSKNNPIYYVQRSVCVKGKSTTKTVERLGSIEEIKSRCGDMEPVAWAKAYVRELTLQEKEDNKPVIVRLSQTKPIEGNCRRTFNVGYLVLQKLYYSLGLDRICAHIEKSSRAAFDLNAIFSMLVYARVIFPCSKRSSFQLAEKFLEKPKCGLHDIYRSLSVLAKNIDYFQAQLYKNSKAVIKRQPGVLYYDCTNFYFETEQEDDFRKYGYSKEHRPNPIVQMGLFMDAEGLPLAFRVFEGNSNEQTSLIPLERRIVSEYGIKGCIICTDAGLSSIVNKRFNNVPTRGFITAQPVRKLKSYLKDFCLDKTGWKTEGTDKLYTLDGIDNLLQNSKTQQQYEKLRDRVFYKERWYREDNMDQRIIVTYCAKYRDCQRNIRDRQWEQAEKKAESGSSAKSKLFRKKSTDPARFLKCEQYTKDGEPATKSRISLDCERYADEAQYDGLYCVCTNLEDNVRDIIRINRGRWEIEESFRIMKSGLGARPVYLSREDHITAHFMVCFTALLIYRVLEKALGSSHTCEETIAALRDMNMLYLEGRGYLPEYSRNDITDGFHELLGFETDREIISQAKMRKFCFMTKK